MEIFTNFILLKFHLTHSAPLNLKNLQNINSCHYHFYLIRKFTLEVSLHWLFKIHWKLINFEENRFSLYFLVIKFSEFWSKNISFKANYKEFNDQWSTFIKSMWFCNFIIIRSFMLCTSSHHSYLFLTLYMHHLKISRKIFIIHVNLKSSLISLIFFVEFLCILLNMNLFSVGLMEPRFTK